MTLDDQLSPEREDDRLKEVDKDGAPPSEPTGASVDKLASSLKKVLFQQEEINFTRQHRNAGAEFISGLDHDQKSRMLDMMFQNDRDNTELHKKRLDNEAQIATQRIRSKGEGIRSFKTICLWLISGFVVLTALFVFTLPQYVSQWLSFVAGLFGGGLGGYGISKSRILDFTNGEAKATARDQGE
jgi:hypothetical protein